MYLVYIDQEGNDLKEFLKVFENIDNAIDFAVDTAYEKSEHKYTKEYLRNSLVKRIVDNPDNEYAWDIPYKRIYNDYSFYDYKYAYVAIAKIKKGD